MILTAVSLCVGLIVLMYRVRQSSMAELDRAMRLMGNDVVILPEGVGLDTYMAGDIGEKSIPQDYVGYAGNMKPPLLSDCRGFYQRKAVIGKGSDVREVIIRGVATAVGPAAAHGLVLEAGEAEIGSAAAYRLREHIAGKLLVIPYQGVRAAADKPVSVPQHLRQSPIAPSYAAGPASVRIGSIREPTGTVKDSMIFVHVDVARRLYGVIQKDSRTGEPLSNELGQPLTEKVVNVIEGEVLPGIGMKTSQIAPKLQDILRGGDIRVEVYSLRGILEGRRKALHSRSRKMSVTGLGVLVFGALTVGGYAILNVRQRRPEMGIMLAIAARQGHVAWMFLEKMLILGALGGAIGCAAGETAARHWGPTGAPEFAQGGWHIYSLALVIAIAVTLLPSLLGVLIASRIDPADTVRNL